MLIYKRKFRKEKGFSLSQADDNNWENKPMRPFIEKALERKVSKMTLYREERYEVKVSRTVLKTSLNWKLFRLSLTLQTLLPEYTLWELGQNGVPELPCHRAVFLEQAFEVFKRGLIISLPEEWMYEWSTLDKRAFWAALSETYGRHTVIAVFADTFDNTRLVEPYLNVKPLSSLPVRVWVSKYQQA